MNILKLKSCSDTFADWIKEVDEVLALTPTHTIDGQELEYSDGAFQDQMRRLQQISLNFEDLPIYPINAQIAKDLIYDHVKGKIDENDKSIL